MGAFRGFNLRPKAATEVKIELPGASGWPATPWPATGRPHQTAHLVPRVLEREVVGSANAVMSTTGRSRRRSTAPASALSVTFLASRRSLL